MPWVFLLGAIVTEVAGTLGLRRISENVIWWVVVLVALGYAVSFSLMTVALRQLNVGVVYAVWSGVGTAAVGVAGVTLFGERLSVQAVAGMVVIVVGVLVLVTSGSVRHG